MKFLLALAVLSGAWTCCCHAATKVAVLEFGAKKGTVRRSTNVVGREHDQGLATTPAGVHSFWNALHRARGRGLQHAGMPLVPDLFAKPDVGIVLALTGNGVDLDRMQVVSSLVEDNSSDSNNKVVGHMELEGSKCHALMEKVDDVKSAAMPTEMSSAVRLHATDSKGLVGVQTTVDASSVASVDKGVGDLLQDLQEWAENSGRTVVLHLVVEEEGGSSRRRARSLPAAALASSSSEQQAARKASKEEEEQQQQQPDRQQQHQRRRLEDEKDGEQNANGDNKQYNGYYGYGYYNAYGEWVTPYKTMFQIQYFNVVLWTSLGLVVSLLFVVYLMVYMPLEPDTLLFGESAKLVGSE